MLRETATPVDLLVTDMMMPGMTGQELVEAAQAVRPQLRVLYLSGYATDPSTWTQPGGAHEFLQKPFAPATLAIKVRELLDRR